MSQFEVMESSCASYAFIDNSQLSVCEKIKQYFLKNPPRELLNDSSSSDSSIELDASFSRMLENTKQMSVIEQNDETLIDLCSPPSTLSHRMSASPSGTPEEATLEKVWLHYDSDESTLVQERSWCLASDESFLEQERLCNLSDNEDTELETTKIEEQHIESIDETQLFDIEAPSTMWDLTVVNTATENLSPTKLVGLNRPSTILEESTLSNVSSDCSTKKSPEKCNYGIVRKSLPKFNYFPNRAQNAGRKWPQQRGSTIYSPLEKSINLMTLDDSFVFPEGSGNVNAKHTEISDDSNSSQDSNKSLSFNDTLEAMEFYMEKGKQMQQQEQQNLLTPRPTATPLIVFSPKTTPNTVTKKSTASASRRASRNFEGPLKSFNARTGKHPLLTQIQPKKNPTQPPPKRDIFDMSFCDSTAPARPKKAISDRKLIDLQLH